MLEDKKKIFICASCGGRGRSADGALCEDCGGLGVGLFGQRAFFYLDLNLSQSAVVFKKIKRILDFIINFFLFLIGFSGLVAFALWVVSCSSEQILKPLLMFSDRDPLLLVFWIGALAFMFIYYRLSLAGENKKIKTLLFDLKKEEGLHDVPDNWLELLKSKNRISVGAGLSARAHLILERALVLAATRKEAISPRHLFVECLKEKDVIYLFNRLGLGTNFLFNKISRYLGANAAESWSIAEMSTAVKVIILEAYYYAYYSGQERVEPVHFVLPAVKADSLIEEIIFDQEIDEHKIFNCLEWLRFDDLIYKNYKLYRRLALYKPNSGMDRAYTSVATPILNRFSCDLTRAAKWGRLKFCVGREVELEKIFNCFLSGHYGALLVGPTGAGKSAVVHGLAQLMVKEDVPEILKDKRLVEIEVSRLVGGGSPAEIEERLLAAVDEAARAGNIVLFIDKVEGLVGIKAGGSGGLDLSEVLVSSVARAGVYCLASVTEDGYDEFLENTAFKDGFEKIKIEEPRGDKAIQMVESQIIYLEGKHKVYFTYEAIEEAVKLSARYLREESLPAKAIKVLEQAAVCASKGKDKMIGRDSISAIISELTKIPLSRVGAIEGQALLKLEDKIHERMIDQEEAVSAVAAALRRARAEMREGKRPIASFLFLGPTGVGKTELAKAVSQVYFGDEKTMIRVDMSEYQLQESVSKMIGDQNGSSGYLTEAVRKTPFSLVLLDEIEKAHSDILNLFLQVIDDGRLTDGEGRTIDFTNSIIIATSNAGARYIQEATRAGEKIEEIKGVLVDEHLSKVMRPELINRFDGIIVFKPLEKEHVFKIAGLMLGKIGKMLKEKGIDFEVKDKGARVLSELGFNPEFGARPLRRLLQEKIENPIANKLLAGELGRRDTVIINDSGEVDIKKSVKL